MPPNNLKDTYMKLKFRVDAIYNGKVVYKAGVHEVSEELGWAQRWINRGAQVVGEELDGKIVDGNVDQDNTESDDSKPRKRSRKQGA